MSALGPAGAAELLLVLSLVLLCQRRPAAMGGVVAAQGAVLAGIIVWQGWEASVPRLTLAGLAALAVLGVALPMALRRAARSDWPPRAGRTPGGLAAFAIGVGLVAVAEAAAPAVETSASGGGAAASALAVVLLAVLLLDTGRDRLAQLLALVSLANGVLLAASLLMPPELLAFFVACVLLVAGAGVVACLRLGPGRAGADDGRWR